MKHVLLLSAYHAASHSRWCQGLIEYFSDWHWTLETLPARYFNWRTRGNSLSWGFGNYPSLEQQYDLIIATSMVDLSALRGFRPHLAQVPTLVYFHENQFAYPASQRQQGLVEIQLTSIYSALSADSVLFNSHYNRNSFLQGAQKLLDTMPDGVPKELVAELKHKSHVLPVPLEPSLFTMRESRGHNISRYISRPCNLLWNHRWEWDKGPERLLLACQSLAGHGVLGRCFRLHVVGEQFRNQPEPFAQLRELLVQHDALGSWGFVASRIEYEQLILQSDAVLATAVHDFQGLSLLEASIMGCRPFAPDRLAYPEWLNPELLYPSHVDQPQLEAQRLAEQLIDWYEKPNTPINQRSDWTFLSWDCLGTQYRQQFMGLMP